MSFSWQTSRILARDGFTQREIREFGKATAPDGTPQAVDINNPVWKEARRDRRAWVKQQREVLNAAGLPKWRINPIIVNEINLYYERGRVRTPFDFIREVYQRSLFGSIAVSDYQNKRATDARRRVNKLYQLKKVRGS